MEIKKIIYFINELLELDNDNIEEDINIINLEIDKEIVTEKKSGTSLLNNSKGGLLTDKDVNNTFIQYSYDNFIDEKKKKLYEFMSTFKLPFELINKLIILYMEKKLELKKQENITLTLDDYIIKSDDIN